MAWSKKGGAKRAAVKKGGQRKKQYRKRRTVPEKASCSVSRGFALLNANQTYRFSDIQLSQYARAVNVAKGYQLYRIKNVKMVVSPLADTFQAGGGVTVPYLYFMIDRTRELDNIRTAAEFKIIGCKPHRVDDKQVIWNFKPSVLNTTLDNAATQGGVFNQYKISPWIRCRDETGTPGVWNPDTTDHQGMVFFLENSGGEGVQFKMEVTVEFEFMKPSYPMTITESHPEPVDLETLAIEVPI